MEYLLSVVGLVLIVEGVPYFLCPDKMKEFLARVRELPEGRLRAFGSVSIILGLVLTFIARRLM